MMDIPEELDVRPSGLPPRSECLIDLSNRDTYYRSVETPTDERGIINISELFTIVKACVVPGYQWPTDRLNVHHLYYPGRLFPDNDELWSNANPYVFRNLPTNKVLIPKQFHELLHWVMKDPPLPDVEVMHYSVEALNVAKNLFKMARNTVQWEKKAQRRRELLIRNPGILRTDFNGEDIIGEEIMEEAYDKHFRAVEYQLARNERIPPEFRLIDTEQEPGVIAQQLGKIVVPTAQHLVRAAAA